MIKLITILLFANYLVWYFWCKDINATFLFFSTLALNTVVSTYIFVFILRNRHSLPACVLSYNAVYHWISFFFFIYLYIVSSPLIKEFSVFPVLIFLCSLKFVSYCTKCKMYKKNYCVLATHSCLCPWNQICFLLFL